MEMIRCPRCAREIPDFSRFCRRCGCAIVWRAQILPGMIPPLPPVQANRSTTLHNPRQTKAAKPAKPVVRSSGGGGAGVFAIFAAAGLVCFVNYHAVMRPVRTTPRSGAVRYESPTIPTLPPEVNTPFIVPPPPPSSPPIPLRSNASPGSSKRYSPRAPMVPMPTTPGAPIAPAPPSWDSEYRYGSPGDSSGTGSTSPERSERR
ncbi:MAG: hypothetical protein JWN40_5426 [Phycisphaerales bacterium]|nr:hypothetical protein [Phycisphaerales bacterium]